MQEWKDVLDFALSMAALVAIFAIFKAVTWLIDKLSD